MDILRVLASTDLEVRKKTLDLVLEVVNSRNIHEVVLILKKEITKTHTDESTTEDSGNYRQILVRTLHACSVKFPDVAESVVPVVSINHKTPTREWCYSKMIEHERLSIKKPKNNCNDFEDKKFLTE